MIDDCYSGHTFITNCNLDYVKTFYIVKLFYSDKESTIHLQNN